MRKARRASAEAGGLRQLEPSSRCAPKLLEVEDPGDHLEVPVSESEIEPVTSAKNAREFLEAHPAVAAEKALSEEERAERLASIKPKQIKGWLATLDENNRQGVRQAWLVGRVLNAQRARVPKGKGNVTKWEKSVAKLLGKEPRTLQLYRQVAEGLDDSKIATALRESHLDDGLNKVVQRIRNVRDGRAPDEGKPAVDTDLGQKLIKQAEAIFQRAMTLDDVNSKRQFVGAVRRWVNGRNWEAMPHDLRVVQGPRAQRRILGGIVPYAGSKAKHVDAVLDWIGHPARQDLIYVEPCVGAGSVLLNAAKRGLVDWVWLNDRNPATAAMWNAIIQHPEELTALIRERGVPDYEDVDSAVDACRGDQGSMSTVYYGYLAMVTHRCTWGGLGDAKTKVLLNDSQLERAWKVDAVCHDVEQASYLLSQLAIWEGRCTCMDAKDVLGQVPLESVVYLDPPYYERGGDNYVFGMKPEDHAALAEALLKSSVPWVLSYDDCEEVRALYGITDGPPVRTSVPRPAAKEIGAEQSRLLKTEVEAAVHRFNCFPDDGEKLLVRGHRVEMTAESVMIEYGISGTHVWKPELRIRRDPLWYLQGQAYDAKERTLVTEAGDRHQVFVPDLQHVRVNGMARRPIMKVGQPVPPVR